MACSALLERGAVGKRKRLRFGGYSPGQSGKHFFRARQFGRCCVTPDPDHALDDFPPKRTGE